MDKSELIDEREGDISFATYATVNDSLMDAEPGTAEDVLRDLADRMESGKY